MYFRLPDVIEERTLDDVYEFKWFTWLPRHVPTDFKGRGFGIGRTCIFEGNEELWQPGPQGSHAGAVLIDSPWLLSYAYKVASQLWLICSGLQLPLDVTRG